VLASTRSPASRSGSSLGPYSGDLGSAIKPVLVDSRIPKGCNELHERVDSCRFCTTGGVISMAERRGMLKTYTSTM
jgi:hypothetical protein